jgi:C-methyltransferase
LHDFLKAIYNLLSDHGVAYIEVPYLYKQIHSNQFQSIAHQHISFFTIETMSNLSRKNGLYVCDHEFVDMDGGSVIFTVKKKKPHIY